MNIRRILGIIVALVVGVSAFAQQPASGSPSSAQTQVVPAKPALTTFDLDFPGGTPGELVAAIQKAMGRPLNVVIPLDETNRHLTPLKMSNIDVNQLFGALSRASAHTIVVGNMQMQSGFMIQSISTPSDDSIWFWVGQNSPQAQPTTRFFLLTPYLNQGLTVDDITTAIQTAWKMRNATSNPTISFHKETKLLIAVGDQLGLETIDQALKALDGAKAKTTTAVEVR